MKLTVSMTQPKPKPSSGDIMTSKHGTFSRRQCTHEGCMVVSHGKPVFEWVQIGEPPVGFKGRPVIKYRG